MNKLLIVSVAGLGEDLLRNRTPHWDVFPVRGLQTCFPSVTCTAQATFRTAAPAQIHGMVANGVYDRRWRKAHFWEQSARLVEGERIWSEFRAAGHTVGMLFWQQSLGEEADVLLSPAPVHKHHGGMVLDCYSRPAGLYPRLKQALGEFPLWRYWGPLASPKVGKWIVSATEEVMRHESPDLLLTYLPTLDYDLQRFGPEDARSRTALECTLAQLSALHDAAGRNGYEMLFWGDYAMAPCSGPAVFPNRALHSEGWFCSRNVKGRLYPDFHTSRALAVCDHEVAHVYVREADDREPVRAFLAGLAGVLEVRLPPAQAHPNSGELVLIAGPGRWFAYPWWEHSREAPDYATQIDIHNKPGFDPCELFGQGLPPRISQDTSRIRGTHGREGRPVAWGGTLSFDPPPADLQELASRVRDWLHS